MSESTNEVVRNALMAKVCNVKKGDKFSPLDDRRLVFKVGRMKNDPRWGLMIEPENMKGEDDWYAMDEVIMLNTAVAANADTEASIDAEAKKLAREVLAIAKKYDALQKRLTKIGIYYTDYQAAANDLRNVHSVIS